MNGQLDAAVGGQDVIRRLGVPSNFADWHWAAQLTQARAVTYAIDHHRRWSPRTAGAIVWQLNDCWPATSWAAIDFEERPKPRWYALRRAYAPRSVVFTIDGGDLSAVIINHTDEAWQGEFELSRQDLDGVAPANAAVEVSVEPRTNAQIVLTTELATPGTGPPRS